MCQFIKRGFVGTNKNLWREADKTSIRCYRHLIYAATTSPCGIFIQLTRMSRLPHFLSTLQCFRWKNLGSKLLLFLSMFSCLLLVRFSWAELKYDIIAAVGGRGFDIWLLKVWHPRSPAFLACQVDRYADGEIQHSRHQVWGKHNAPVSQLFGS